VYIDREDDWDTLFGKAADFSRESILNLEKEGYNDTQKAIQEYAGLVVSKEGSYKIPNRKNYGELNLKTPIFF
jgi:hypothetical protein